MVSCRNAVPVALLAGLLLLRAGMLRYLQAWQAHIDCGLHAAGRKSRKTLSLAVC
jgi:hypothetical protein